MALKCFHARQAQLRRSTGRARCASPGTSPAGSRAAAKGSRSSQQLCGRQGHRSRPRIRARGTDSRLLTAFDRFFADAIKSDPQCWAKNALSRTLAALEHQDAAIFLRGMRHIQFEPVWGGRSDTAGTLRGTCALALVQCRSLSESELLNHLIELFADEDKSVRVEAARAVEQVGSPSAAAVAAPARSSWRRPEEHPEE